MMAIFEQSKHFQIDFDPGRFAICWPHLNPIFPYFFIGFLTIIYKKPYKKQGFLIQFAKLEFGWFYIVFIWLYMVLYDFILFLHDSIWFYMILYCYYMILYEFGGCDRNFTHIIPGLTGAITSYWHDIEIVWGRKRAENGRKDFLKNFG